LITLQPASYNHLELVCHIIKESFQKQAKILAITQEKYLNFVAFETVERVPKRMNSGDQVIISFINDEPMGTVSYKADHALQKGIIRRLAVLPKYRGYGYGELLMSQAEQQLKQENIRYIELAIVAQFQGLQRYYERLGYMAKEKNFFPPYPLRFYLWKRNCIILRQGQNVRASKHFSIFKVSLKDKGA